MPRTVINNEVLVLIERLYDHYTTHGNGNLANQIIKIQEELGEAAAAYIGWTGTNPRKGVTHTRYDVAMELADVIVTSLLAIRYADIDINMILEGQVRKMVGRLDEFDTRG